MHSKDFKVAHLLEVVSHFEALDFCEKLVVTTFKDGGLRAVLFEVVVDVHFPACLIQRRIEVHKDWEADTGVSVLVGVLDAGLNVLNSSQNMVFRRASATLTVAEELGRVCLV